MSKPNPNKAIQKPRTEEEFLAALALFEAGHPQKSNPPDVDDTDIVLLDGIRELMEARRAIESVRGFATQWLAQWSPRR